MLVFQKRGDYVHTMFESLARKMNSHNKYGKKEGTGFIPCTEKFVDNLGVEQTRLNAITNTSKLGPRCREPKIYDDARSTTSS